MTNLYYQLPESVSGYQLDADISFWGVCVAEATRNLFLDPSFESQTGGPHPDYDALFGTMAYFGTSVDQNFTSEAAGSYTFSCHVRTYQAGRDATCTVTVALASTPNSPFFTRTFTATSAWRRHAFTFSAAASTAYKVKITCASNISTDGWQAENKQYATTYVDGDSGVYCLDDYREFYWTGQPHASISVRTDRTRLGGRIVSLNSVNFRTTSIQGFGRAPVDQAFTTTLSGTQIPESMVHGQRELVIGGTIIGGSPSALVRDRRALMALFAPTYRDAWQPLLLTCQLLTGDEYQLICYYKEGLEGEIDNLYQQNFAITLNTVEPHWRGPLQAKGVAAMAAPTAYRVLARDMLSGNYTAWEYSVGSGSTYALDSDSAGAMYAAGTLTGNVHKLRPAGSNATTVIGTASLYTGTSDGLAVSKSGDGKLVVVGDYEHNGSHLSLNFWNGSAWEDFAPNVYLQYPWMVEGSNTIDGGTAKCVLWHNGYFYVGGTFSRVRATNSSVSEIDLVARFDPVTGTWAPLALYGLARDNNIYNGNIPPEGADACCVSTITYGNDGYLYLTGTWRATSHNNAAVSSHSVCRYNLTTDRFEDVMPIHVKPNAYLDNAYAAAMSPNGVLHMLMPYGNGSYLEKPNGSAWARNFLAVWYGGKLGIDFAHDGTLFVAGSLYHQDQPVQTMLWAVGAFGALPGYGMVDMLVPNSGNPIDKDRTALKVYGRTLYIALDGLAAQLGTTTVIENDGDEVARFGLLAGHLTITYGIVNASNGHSIIFDTPIVVPYGTTFAIQELNGTLYYRNLLTSTDRYVVAPVNTVMSDMRALDLMPGTNYIKILYAANSLPPAGNIMRGYSLFWHKRQSSL